ncbi:hypothetical protein BATDEDRAFT_87883 [Batrachochytrium dendrobatidis JAM81]|uniref:LIM zinc-binding domain-containing protein n=1 Tax=Batrachochytrium dendrobatidis (strain JAM81 / FGSC 10211) TaxID=684364 RepID=F4P0G4_BATDJ|nr:uncharacterized protein BATDEDRAFT_87883 [Batrachochytrium dendrobatidis JAM81]EGF81279.1 hypothetical protein BATDEDRAFT_87883 [Batrachochytrium dendrobatidis JAM81]|eukprot:XP_006678150.1 hypothetical protein BATDEDRAFT_87883 [Batrachochytrium dendrobatidis JAM81]
MPEQPSGTNVSTCKTCGQGFEIGAAIIFKDAQYHSWCFHCSACATKLDPENSLVPSLTAGKCNLHITDLQYALIGTVSHTMQL